MKYKCPICNQELIKIDNVFRCINRHNYDISKEGYVNLLKKQGGKEFGDSKEMVISRREFFNKDYYKPLKEELRKLIMKHNPNTVLDLGSGEGYYTNFFKDELDIDIVGIDISKEAVKISSKKNKNVNYIVSSVQDIPLFDSSIDLVINNFTPLELNEIYRVLKNEGILITTKVGRNHLLELKQAIYENVYLNDNETINDERFILLDSKILSFKIKLDNNKDIKNLFNMTPYSHHTSLESKKKLETIDNIEITCEFNIDIYKKK